MSAHPAEPIARRLFRLNALATALIALLIVAAFALRQGAAYVGDEERQLRLLAGMLAADLGPSLAADEVDRAEAVLTSLQADPLVAAAGVYDKRGALFASYRRSEGKAGKLDLLPETAPAPQVLPTHRSLEVSVAVPAGASEGIVYVRKDLDWRGLLTPIVLTGLGVLAGGLLLAFFSSSLIGGGLSSRLDELAALARNASARHDYDVEVPVRGPDEVARLARALDELLRDFRRRDEEKAGSLREAKASLESLRASAQRWESQQGLLEREAAVHQSQRSQAEAARREFAGHLRAELREPVEALLQGVRALRRDAKPAAPPHRELLAVDRSARHLLAVIDDALALSSESEAGGVPAQAPFDLPALLGGLAEVFRVRLAAKPVAFAFEPVGALPQTVTGDAAGLRRALLGLLGNAIRFTERGRIDLAVGAVGAAGPRLRFEIRDTGLPLAAAAANEAEADRAAGPRFAAPGGIGLARAQQLVAALGGTLKMRARSESGEPAFNVFWFDLELPAASAPAPDPLSEG